MLQRASANAILDGLNSSETAALDAHALDVPLDRGSVLADAGETSSYVYFPTSGVLSLIGTTASGSTVEVAVVGNEGVASVSAILGQQALPFGVITQVQGRAIRLPTDVVTAMMGDCGELHRRILAYTDQVLAQVAHSAVCNRFHSGRQRLARWLLMTADRSETSQLPLTHEFIAYMVGGPRSAVTEAAAELRDSGAIAYRRGLIEIRDRERLRAMACECYGVLAVVPAVA